MNDSIDHEAIRAHFAGRIEPATDLLGRLVAARTVNPPGSESAAADVVRSELDALSVPYRTFAKVPGRDNVTAEIGSGRGPRLLVPCHLDTVPAGEGWSTDPFAPVVKGGRLYGRGSCDNKGALAGALEAARYLAPRASGLEGTLVLAAVADEETGSALGLEYLLAETGLEADYGIVPDSGGMLREIVIAEKGGLWLELRSFGRQAHGSRPEAGFNAIDPLVDLVAKLRRLDLGAGEHTLLSPPTLNLGCFNGGTAPNMVPASAAAKADIRYLPPTTAAEIEARARAMAEEVMAARTGSRIEVEVVMDLAPIELAPGHPLVGAIVRAAEAVRGERPETVGMSGTTVAKQMMFRGIAALNFGPGDGKVAHMADEYIELEQVTGFAAVLSAAALDLVGPGASP
jgi:acetylornithine deacetylase/succinyl-diaminopimelate desuccinylase family protein